jgi:hypothetical protein
MEECIRQRGIKVVIVDEAEHLTKMVNARRLQDQMDTIKSLASLSAVQFVMIGTYELLALLNQNGQLARRTRSIHFRRYDYNNPADRQSLINLLGMFESRLPVPAGGLLVNHADFIYEHCLGCIGVLKSWLMEASIRAVDARRGALTMADLEATVQTDDALLQMLQEIIEGERSVGGWTQRGGELRAKLDLQQVISPAAAPGSAIVPPIRRSVGERKPIRDPVRM